MPKRALRAEVRTIGCLRRETPSGVSSRQPHSRPEVLTSDASRSCRLSLVVRVPVVDVRVMAMRMDESLVAMGMTMWLTWGIVGRVRMLVMLVVNVRVRVFHLLVDMLVFVPLG